MNNLVDLFKDREGRLLGTEAASPKMPLERYIPDVILKQNRLYFASVVVSV